MNNSYLKFLFLIYSHKRKTWIESLRKWEFLLFAWPESGKENKIKYGKLLASKRRKVFIIWTNLIWERKQSNMEDYCQVNKRFASTYFLRPKTIFMFLSQQFYLKYTNNNTYSNAIKCPHKMWALTSSRKSAKENEWEMR